MLSDILLDDIMVSILSRLPSKSLLQFKVVSKSWCQLIGSPQFIDMHYQTRAAINNNGCFLTKLTHLCHYCLVYVDSPTWTVLEDLIPSRFENKIVSQCNGILFLIKHHERLLWNPAIRRCINLPSSVIRSLGPPPGFHSPIPWDIGICFDPTSDRYKVIGVWSFAVHVDRIGGTMYKVEIWTQGKDTWEVIDTKVEVWTPDKNKWRVVDTSPRIPLPRYNRPIYLKGKLYWISTFKGSDEFVSFDSAVDVFRVAPIPTGECCKQSFSPVKLALLNESIAAFSKPLEHNAKCFEIWLLNGDQVSWSKYMTVEVPPFCSAATYLTNQNQVKPKMCPLEFCNNGQLIFRDEYCGRLVFFNMTTGKAVHSGLEVNSDHRIYVYNESLVPINTWLK